MIIYRNHSLLQQNTMKIDAKAAYYTEVNELEDISEAINHHEFAQHSKYILGGGSNILFLKDIKGWVLHNQLKGIEIIDEDQSYSYIKAYAGEQWDDLVKFAVDHKLGGIENLSAIPGQVGASPIQNIGAYGVELESVFVSLSAISLHNGETSTFNHAQCQFGYRSSIFKTEGYKHNYFITDITLKLQKKPVFTLDYPDVNNYLENVLKRPASLESIRQAITEIRASKLPDPKIIANCGSFFKNPLVKPKLAQQLKQEFPNMPQYEAGELVKLSAAWLIEQCGWKGKRLANAGVYDKHALVIVNYGSAKGKEIFTFSEYIMGDVKDKFGVLLEREVNVI